MADSARQVIGAHGVTINVHKVGTDVDHRRVSVRRCDATHRRGCAQECVSVFDARVEQIQIAQEMDLREKVVRALNGSMVASIGPLTSQTLREQGIAVDLEPTHPKMGFLVKEAAEQSAGLLSRKRKEKE